MVLRAEEAARDREPLEAEVATAASPAAGSINKVSEGGGGRAADAVTSPGNSSCSLSLERQRTLRHWFVQSMRPFLVMHIEVGVVDTST